MRHLLRALAAVLLCTSAPGFAQYTIEKITITNAAPYSDDEILSIAGLQPGQMLTRDSLANAAQHLMDTGLFEDAQVSANGQGKARVVLLKPVPIALAKLIPASFTNFVFWTPEELTGGLKARVPIYHGVVSNAGDMPDLIQAALTQMVSEKGVTATISHTTPVPSAQYPLGVMSFHIDQPRVRLASVNITGTPPQLAGDAATVFGKGVGMPYSEGLTGSSAEFFLTPARNAGYIAATLTHVQRTPTISDGGIGIAYSAELQAGDIYKVTAITFTPTQLVTDADFAKLAQLHSGDIASAAGLAKTNKAILTAYRAHGYIDAYVDPAPTLDKAAHTVAYALTVSPGEMYHLHSVKATGLSPADQAKFDSLWTLKPGEPYDESYLFNFITHHSELPTASYQADSDSVEHTVDLVLFYRRSANR